MRNKKQLIIHNIYKIIQLYKLKMTFYFFRHLTPNLSHIDHYPEFTSLLVQQIGAHALTTYKTNESPPLFQIKSSTNTIN